MFRRSCKWEKVMWSRICPHHVGTTIQLGHLRGSSRVPRIEGSHDRPHPGPLELCQDIGTSH
jgi:hypothetical protein